MRLVSFSYLHHDFESVQGCGERPGHRSSSSACNQVPPPHPGLLLLYGELIRHHQVLTHIEYLPERSTNIRLSHVMVVEGDRSYSTFSEAVKTKLLSEK